MHNENNLNQFVDRMIGLLNVGQIKELSEKPELHQARAYYRATVKKGIVNIGKQIEVPVLSGKSVSHRNTIDCIIEVTLECIALERVAGYDWDGNNTKSKMFDIYILCEYKPKLDEVSAYLGQIHLYVRRLQDMYGDAYNKPTIIPVLITLDDMTDFDPLFTNDGIHIFRLAWDANTNTVVNLSEPQSPNLEAEAETQTKLTGE